MDKKTIRQEIRAALSALTADVRRAEATVVIERLRALVEERKPSVVALFSPLPDEINIFPLVESLDCRILLPRITPASAAEALMEFYDYAPEAMADGSFGISEPQGGKAATAADIDIMILPGVAFTRTGCRLGRGRGYYDRYLAREGFRALKVGVCHSCQLRESLPHEAFDIEMDIIITAE